MERLHLDYNYIKNINNRITKIEYPIIASIDDITDVFLQTTIYDHFNSIVPKFDKNDDYYLGLNAGIPRIDPDNPSNRINIPYGRTMSRTVKGYMFSSGYIRYRKPVETDENYYDYLMHVFEANKEDLQNSELGENQSKYGIAFEIIYLDKDKDGIVIPAFCSIHPKEIIPLFDMSMKKRLIGCIRYYPITKEKDYIKYKVYVYLPNTIKEYNMKYNHSTKLPELTFVEEKENIFKDIPLVFYLNNEEITSDYEPVQTLIDLFDDLISDSANELNRFASAYMILKNYILGGNEEEESVALQKIKKMRLFEVGSDGEVQFLTKDIPTAFFQEIKNLVREEISYHSSVPDFRDQAFGTASGIAIKYKILNFENTCAGKESLFRAGLERRKEIIDRVLRIKTYKPGDVEIIFNRNLPANLAESSDIVLKLKNSKLPISNLTLLSLLSFVEDAESEIDKYKQEQEEADQAFDIDNISPNPQFVNNQVENDRQKINDKAGEKPAEDNKPN
jgi:SPP1 family phage portal protein